MAGIGSPGTHTRQRQDGTRELLVVCWCGRSLLWLTSAEVRAGHTAVCGHPRCRMPDGRWPQLQR